MYGLYIKFDSSPHSRCVWQEDVCSRMPSGEPYGAKWQNRVGPVSSLLADTLPQCGMVLNECRSNHSVTPWSLFFHLYPTAVLHQIRPPPISWIHYQFYSIHLPHTVAAVWSSSSYELWWVLWNLGSSSLKVPSTQANPQIFNHFGHLMWASAQIRVCVSVWIL